jgi:hypothetical protein
VIALESFGSEHAPEEGKKQQSVRKCPDQQAHSTVLRCFCGGASRARNPDADVVSGETDTAARGRRKAAAWNVDGVFLKKGIEKIKLGKGVPVGKILKNGYLLPADWAGGVGPGTSRPSSGRDVLRETLHEFFICEEVPAGAGGDIRPIQRAGCCPEGHPALWSGGMSPSPLGYISRTSSKNFILFSKIRKKKKERRGREKRKRRNPVHTSIWRYILILGV